MTGRVAGMALVIYALLLVSPMLSAAPYAGFFLGYPGLVWKRSSARLYYDIA